MVDPKFYKDITKIASIWLDLHGDQEVVCELEMPLQTLPRLLTADQAAIYLSLPKATVVREGIGRIRLSAFTRYDIRAIDAWLDGLSGLSKTNMTQAAPSAANDDAEAAFDRFVEHSPNASRRS